MMAFMNWHEEISIRNYLKMKQAKGKWSAKMQLCVNHIDTICITRMEIDIIGLQMNYALETENVCHGIRDAENFAHMLYILRF